MKATALALVLLTATVQTVGWVECCCILICKHRNDLCSDCRKSKTAQEPMAHADCCDKSVPAPAEPVHEKRCAHIEGSSEVLPQDAPPPPVQFDLVLDLPVIPDAPAPSDRDEKDGLSRYGRGSPPPLHLLYSVLLI